MRQRKFYALSALATGLLLALSLPDNGGLTPLVFIAWVPLLLAEERYATSSQERRPRFFMTYVLLAMAVWNACTTWWLFCVSGTMDSRLFAVIGPNVGNDLLFWVPWLLMRWGRWFFNGRVVRWVLVFSWTAFEHFHMNWDLSWPWLTLGNVFAEHPTWIQWYELTGHLGGSLWVWVVNLAICNAWMSHAAGTRSIDGFFRSARWAAVILLLPLVGSLLRYFTYEEKGAPHEVVVVQPNIDPYTTKFETDPLVQLDSMLALANKAITPATRLVAMPETALQENSYLSNGLPGEMVFHGLWENDLTVAESTKHIRAFLEKHPGLSLVTGMTSYYLFPRGAQLPASARMLDDVGRGYDGYNAALLVRSDGTVESYRKSKLVPGVELLPFEGVLGSISALSLDLGGTTGSLGTQGEREVLATPNGELRFAPVICYESIYGDHVAAHVRNGASFITVLTNDAWWSDSPAYRQHLAFGRLRAIENRRSIARSANTGISCFIDQRGDVHQATTWWTTDAVRGQVLANSELTLFSRTGDLIGPAACYLVGAWLLVLLFSLIRRSTRR